MFVVVLHVSHIWNIVSVVTMCDPSLCKCGVLSSVFLLSVTFKSFVAAILVAKFFPLSIPCSPEGLLVQIC